jgi:hypothetical protein
MKEFVNVANKDGVSMSESIAQKLIDAAEDYKNSAVKYALAPSTGAPNESQAYDDSYKAMVQLAQEVEKELNGLRTGQTIVDPQFKDRYVELVADLFKQKQRESIWRELDICYQEIMNVNYSGVSTRKIIMELRAQLGLTEE